MRLNERLIGRHGALLIVDMQEKLLARMRYRDLIVANSVRLVQGAQQLGLPVWATEQYPEGLGPTTAELAGLIPERARRQHSMAARYHNSWSNYTAGRYAM